MAQFLTTSRADFETEFAALLSAKREDAAEVDAAVAEILQDVRARGAAAVLDATARFDSLELTEATMRLSDDEIAAAEADCDPADLAALDLAAERIEAYHRRQLPQDASWEDAVGMRLGWRWTPVDAAGLYAPGGLASYPSSVLMNALPARAAGVKRLALCVPAPRGQLNPLVLAAARRAGVHEIYRIGGAQAIGALAYGAGPIAPVDVVVGPGNAYVATAKRQVFGRVGIDSIAGPSEVVVIADAGADPDWVAIDMMSQAEHDPSAQAILITDDAGFADRVRLAVDRCLETLERREIAGASWAAHGAIIVTQNLDEAAAVSDRLAPEHLEIVTADPDAVFAKIRHAGAAFLGAETPEAIGDYVGGPNHVLPTARSARHASGLSVLDFMKRTTVARATPAALAAIGPSAERLAIAEGLEAHALSVRRRLDHWEKPQ